MLILTTENVPGHRVLEAKGPAFGVMVRSRGMGGNFVAGLRGLFGGEIKEYTAMIEQARGEALGRLAASATAMGGNAVICMRFDNSEIAENMSEIVAYGTVVVVAPL